MEKKSEELVPSTPTERKLNDDINILLVGETGVGKSTFVNSFANYVAHKYIDNLEKGKLHVLIPTSFRIKDKFNVEHEIKVGNEDECNEFLEVGASATQGVKPYVFGIFDGKVKLRLIDTPGTGDTKGVEQDEINCQNIIGYIEQLGRLNGICFLFKPTNARLTAHFEYCLWQILTRLDKAACKNIVFLFTNTRSSNYSPGDTLGVLMKIVNDLRIKCPDIDIPLDVSRNVFCFDSESFRYAAALKKNISFDDHARSYYKASWEHSVKQCWSLIRYLNNDPKNPLHPYIPDKLMAVNMARNVFTKLAPILSETGRLIESSNFAMERMRQNRDRLMDEIVEMKNKKIVIVDVHKESAPYPIMLCASTKCSQTFKFGEEKKYHYQSVCHRNCTETGDVQRDIIGNPAIASCIEIDKLTRQCLRCGCDFSLHMIVGFETSLVETYDKDTELERKIVEKDKEVEEIIQKIKLIGEKNKQLKSEKKSVLGLCTQLVVFLNAHAMTLVNNSYKEYVLYLINVKQLIADPSEETEIAKMKKMLETFDETNKLYDDAIKAKINITWDANPEGYIEQRIRNLFDLELNGPTIKRIFETRDVSNNFRIDDYIHTAVFRKKDKSDTKKNKGKQKNKDNSAINKTSEKNKDSTKETKGQNGSKKKPDDNNKDVYKSLGRPPVPLSEESHGNTNHQAKGKKPNNNLNDKAPKNAPLKKKNVNDNKTKKELHSFTAEELQQMLDEKLKMDKAVKKSNTRPPRLQNAPQRKNEATGSNLHRSRTPPPPYTTVSGGTLNNPQQSYQNHPTHHHPQPHEGPHRMVYHPPPLSGYPPHHPQTYNHPPSQRESETHDDYDVVEVKIKVPKKNFNEAKATASHEPHPNSQYPGHMHYPQQGPCPPGPSHPPSYYPSQPYPYPPQPSYQPPVPPFQPFHSPLGPQPQKQRGGPPPSAQSKASSQKQNQAQAQRGGNHGFRGGGRGSRTQFKQPRGNKGGGNNSGNESDSSVASKR